MCNRNDGSDLVKVLDFGIAKLHVGGSGTGLTHTGRLWARLSTCRWSKPAAPRKSTIAPTSTRSA